MLMCGQMVQATQRDVDPKTQTRRIMNPQPHPNFLARGVVGVVPQWPHQDGVRWFMADGCSELIKCPYGKPGDRLWVRETHSLCGPTENGLRYVVLKDGTQVYSDGQQFPGLKEYAPGAFDHIKWRPSIFMPRWASRITLEIVRIRVERVQDITDADALAEGIERGDEWNNAPAGIWLKNSVHVDRFARLWDSINKARSHGWEKNDWVWVVEFKRVPQPTKEAA